MAYGCVIPSVSKVIDKKYRSYITRKTQELVPNIYIKFYQAKRDIRCTQMQASYLCVGVR